MTDAGDAAASREGRPEAGAGPDGTTTTGPDTGASDGGGPTAVGDDTDSTPGGPFSPTPTPTPGSTPDADPDADPDPLAVARSYLLAVKRGESPDEFAARLADLSERRLAAALSDDDATRAFWVNVYNAAVQHRLGADPDRWDRRNRFFRSTVVTVAGHDLSPNAIEHGLLRRSMWSLGLGYVPWPFPDRFERTYRVAERDPRIHFALNCGAAACPPIAAYEADAIDDQLRLATESYLHQEVAYDAAAGEVRVPRLFLWYAGDFGGRSGTVAFCREHGVLPAGADPSVRYQSYDWSRSLGEFRSFDAE
jgi:hypothetical protein